MFGSLVGALSGMNDYLLRVEGFGLQIGGRQITQNISFALAEGESVALLGRSGSGKTLTALALLGIHPGEIISGKALFRGKTGEADLFAADRADLHRMRGKEIGMVFQEPGMCLNPARKCGTQLGEILQVHLGISAANAEKEVLFWMNKAGLGNAEEIAAKYPHQLSGGQKQRLMIAMAMAPGPKLLIADEPTSSLDTDNAVRIMETLTGLCKEGGTALLLITHEPETARKYTSRCLVAEGGKFTAECASESIFSDSAPEVLQRLTQAELKTKSPFPPLPVQESSILRVENLSVSYRLRTGMFSHKEIPVLKNLSFDLMQGETLGIAGPSGVGKSTLAGVLTGGVVPSEGKVVFQGGDLIAQWAEKRRSLRGKIAQVFQDPYGSLNPKLRVGSQISEVIPPGSADGADYWLERVGLLPADARKYPHEFSGGQRQRVALARALACRPELLVCDECVSALDNVTKWEILQLLDSLRREFGISMLFISHDEEALRVMCSHILRLA